MVLISTVLFITSVIHLKCLIDSDGRPQKCAVPIGKGSSIQLLADGEITWREFVRLDNSENKFLLDDRELLLCRCVRLVN